MVESMDNGKPIRETMTIDVPYSSDHFRYFAGAIRTEEGTASVLKDHVGHFMNIILHEPIGVVGQIVPWNFPFLMAAWKLAPALAAGDCIVFMLDHPGFRKLAFTGSTEVGLDVAKAAADKLIPSTLELGGKSANIFFEDCDWDRALDGLQLGILFNQGQVCCAGSRVFVQESIYDKFVEAAVKAFNQVNVGDPLDPNTQMGSQVDQGQLKKIMSYVELAKEEGATIACGGEPCKEGACAMANDSVYGLGGAVWTQDINRAFRVARAIETGRMWVNTYNMIPAGAPFGGYKQSGIGRETHKVILEHYTQQKNIMINLNETPSGFYPAK